MERGVDDLGGRSRSEWERGVGHSGKGKREAGRGTTGDGPPIAFPPEEASSLDARPAGPGSERLAPPLFRPGDPPLYPRAVGLPETSAYHMEAAILAWLQDVAIRAFGLSLFLLLAIDGAFALVIFATRDRAIVNRWTSRVLAANLVLAGTGIGVPVLALGSRLAIRAVAPFIPSLPGTYIKADADDEPGR